MRARAELALVGITVIWGATFAVVKAALADVSTFLFLALRFTVAAAALGLVYRNAVRRSAWRPGLLAGGLLFTAYAFQTLGLKLTTPSRSAFLTGLAIPLVPLASSLVYRNKPRLVEVAGIVVATLGMMLLTVPSTDSLSPAPLGMGRGDLLSFLCAVTFALHIVVIGHYSPMVGFESLAFLQIAVAAAAASLLFPFAEPVRFHPTPLAFGAVAITGVLATALAFTTQAWAQKYTSATRGALIFALEPVVAWLTSWALTGETMANRGKVGAGTILAGILLVECARGGRGAETNSSASTSQEKGSSPDGVRSDRAHNQRSR